MRISIRHQLRFDLGQGARHAVEQLLLTPQSGPTQTVLDWNIEMDGFTEAARFIDAYGNIMHLVSQTRPAGEKLVTVSGTVETHDRNGILGRIAGEPVPAFFKRVTPLTNSPASIHGKFRDAGKGYGERLGLLHNLMEHIGELHSFRAETPTDAAQGTAQGQSQSQSQGGQAQSQSQAPATAEAAKARSPASAEDFAHMFVGAARALDIPARYVTGYLAGSDEAEASFHAWAEAYDDSLGWIAFDAALGYCPTDQHVRLATGLDSLTTMPLRSIPNGSKPELVTLSVDTGEQ